MERLKERIHAAKKALTAFQEALNIENPTALE